MNWRSIFGRRHLAPVFDNEEPHRSRVQGPAWDYTQTQVVPVTQETLAEHRIVAHLKTDPRATPFYKLRTQLLQRMKKEGWRTVGVTAAMPEAGKSLVSINLAISMAMNIDQSVMLVDMDLRNPTIHRYFDIEPELALQDHLDEGVPISDILINPGIERLVLLPGRRSTLYSAERLGTPELRSMVRDVRERYESRVVIFDLPPVLVSDDVMVIAPALDCILFVVEDGRTTADEIRKSLAILQPTPLVGSVLNKAAENPLDSYY